MKTSPAETNPVTIAVISEIGNCTAGLDLYLMILREPVQSGGNEYASVSLDKLSLVSAMAPPRPSIESTSEQQGDEQHEHERRPKSFFQTSNSL